MELLRVKYKQKRLSIDLIQSGLSTRSSVSLGSESIGQISLSSLLKLSLVLECLEDFKNIANIKNPIINSLSQIVSVKGPPFKKRGSIKCLAAISAKAFSFCNSSSTNFVLNAEL
jgi:hypothetical protein